MTPELHVERAVRAYAAMRRDFLRRDGLYRRDGRPRLPGAAAHLWPAARAFAGAVDLLGVRRDLLAGFDAEAAVASHLVALERYWDAESELPAYASDIIGSRFGGDRYYDDNAWVGLALVQLERLAPGRGHLERAEQLFRFAVAGWDTRPRAPSPGGVFWVEQGVGRGARNHDRNTVSNAPNAELGLHLAELRPGADDRSRRALAHDMYAWVNATLDAGGEAAEPGTGLFWDKLRGDGTIDHTQWTYNQGSMIGANVLLARGDGGGRPGHLERAEAIAGKALDHYAGVLDRQPAAFNAILFRNLLLLHAATGDTDLRERIRATMLAYAEAAWTIHRDPRDRFHFSRGGVTLLDQSAMVQIHALLAWDPGDYGRLA
ncbi:MAG: glycoside hydrolase family 76 protein [Solirubrobacteraceae bacterium]